MDPATKKTIDVLKILLKVDNIEIIKYTIESLIEELQDLGSKKKKLTKQKD